MSMVIDLHNEKTNAIITKMRVVMNCTYINVNITCGLDMTFKRFDKSSIHVFLGADN